MSTVNLSRVQRQIQPEQLTFGNADLRQIGLPLGEPPKAQSPGSSNNPDKCSWVSNSTTGQSLPGETRGRRNAV